MSDYQKRTPERLVEILRSSDQNPRSWNQEAADEIDRLRAELAQSKESKDYQKERAVSSRRSQQDLAKGIDHWRERAEKAEARLASANERVAEMQHEAGMYHSLYDVATERLASARKALEDHVLVPREATWTMTMAGCDSLLSCEHVFGSAGEMLRNAYRKMVEVGALPLTDEKGQS